MPIARLNTQSAFLPFLSTQVGQNVLASSEVDKHFVVRAAYVGRPAQDKDIGIPMPIYGENILPTSIGWESISYREKIRSIPNSNFNQVHVLRGSTEHNVLFSPAQGKNYIASNNTWTPHPLPDTVAGLVTTAYLKLRSFICYQRQTILEYNVTTQAFTTPSITGLDLSNIDGITTANNAMIAWNETSIFWSSFIDPIDFTPSLSSGAGTMNPTQARGRIVACLPTADGFIIYTTANAIHAAWSNNIRFPWVLTEIKGSSGITNPEHVTFEANYSGHFAWTSNGLMSVTKGEASLVFPEVTDFLTGNLVEEFIGTTHHQSHQNLSSAFSSLAQTWNDLPPGANLLQQIKLTQNPWIKLTLVGSRFLCISYGYKTHGIYDWVIVYDTSLERFGKLRIPHVDVFNYRPQPGEQPQANTSIGLINNLGLVSIVDFSYAEHGQGVLFYGRLQVAQGTWLQLNKVELQCTRSTTPELLISPSYDGVNLEQPQIPYVAIDTAHKKEWFTRISALSVNLIFYGDFSISSAQIDFSMGGSR